MIISISWRNIWRNKVRSSVILTAIVIGVFSGAYMWAFYGGMVQQRIRTAIKSEASHIQIHHPMYLQDPDQKYIISNAPAIVSEVQKLSSVKAVSSRTIMNSMISSAYTGSGVKITGIDPENEKHVTNIGEKIVEGSYFSGSNKNRIVIGAKLAEKLKIKLKSHVFLYLQQPDGIIVKVAFRVAGIYKTGNTAFEELNVFVKNSDLHQLLGTDVANANEIAILLEDKADLHESLKTIQTLWTNLDVKSWRELLPEVSLVEETMDVSMLLIMAIILLGLLFGIINTMLMSVLERVKELGMLMAIGMTRFRIFLMIMLETVFLALTGGIAGMVVALILIYINGKTGLDLSAWSDAYARMGYESIIYPVIEFRIILYIAIMVFFTGIAGAIMPAVKALKLRPAEAIRIDV